MYVCMCVCIYIYIYIYKQTAACATDPDTPGGASSTSRAAMNDTGVCQQKHSSREEYY